MNIKKYYDCFVKLVTVDGRTFIGHVSEYYYADENENGLQSIVLECPAFDEPMEFFDNEIDDITMYEAG